MNIKSLKELIKDLPDDTDVLLHTWRDNGSVFNWVNVAVNDDWQNGNKVLLLTRGPQKFGV